MKSNRKVRMVKKDKVKEIVDKNIGDIDEIVAEELKSSLWELIEPTVNGAVNGIDTDEIRLLIDGFIHNAERKGVLPKGLEVKNINAYISVVFGLREDCPKKNRDRLMGYVSGRLSLL